MSLKERNLIFKLESHDDDTPRTGILVSEVSHHSVYFVYVIIVS